jgi:hypothetical protein
MLPESVDERRRALDGIYQVLAATGELTGEARERFMRIVHLFDLGEADVVSAERMGIAKAS